MLTLQNVRPLSRHLHHSWPARNMRGSIGVLQDSRELRDM
jgi:hypothetical protein